MAQINGITPVCKYQHGELLRVTGGGAASRFGLVADVPRPGAPLYFGGVIFVCPTCGYTEFFDDDVPLTVRQEKEMMAGNTQ